MVHINQIPRKNWSVAIDHRKGHKFQISQQLANHHVTNANLFSEFRQM
jgi:hypothetical protein